MNKIRVLVLCVVLSSCMTTEDVSKVEQHTGTCVLPEAQAGGGDVVGQCNFDWNRLTNQVQSPNPPCPPGAGCDTWPPTTIIWQGLSCYDTINAHECSIGWSDGSQWGNYITRCWVFFLDLNNITCTTSLMR